MTITRATAVALVGAILGAAGTVLPWISATAGIVSLSRSGLELGGDAQILAAAAVIGGLGVVWGKPAGLVVGIIAGLAVLLVGYVDLQDIQQRVASLDAGVGSVGPGIWVSLLGGALLAAGSFLARRELPQMQKTPATPEGAAGDVSAS